MFPAQAIPRVQVQTWKGGTGGDLQVVYWVGRRFSKEVSGRKGPRSRLTTGECCSRRRAG